MSNKLPELEQPLNANERYLYAMAIRLDVLVHMISSFIEFYAKNHQVPTTSNKVEEKIEVQEVQPRRTRKK